MVRVLEGLAGFFEIGLTLRLAGAVETFIRELLGSGRRVFLDYDIASTLRKAVSRAVSLGVSFLTVHGSSQLIRGAVEGRGASNLKLLAVTVLTSIDIGDIAEVGYTKHTVEQLVQFRVRTALEVDCDGVIASGGWEEKCATSKQVLGTSYRRSLQESANRAALPMARSAARRRNSAILAVADYLVVSRLVLNAPAWADYVTVTCPDCEMRATKGPGTV